MKAYLRFLVPVLLLAFTFTQTGCSSDAQSKNADDPEEEQALPVEATAVTTGSIAAFFTGTASLEAEEEALVVAKASGVATEIFVEEGQYVKQGDPLAKLDDDRARLELERANVLLAKQQSAYDRISGLHEKQLISSEEFERVKSEYETQQAARDLAQLELEHTVVRAPISGIISERLIKQGNMVTTNAPTFHITDFDPLLAILHVPERELNLLRSGQKAELRLDAMPGQMFTGTIKRISPVVDPSTGTFKVTVEVRDSSRKLKPGMFGRVQIVYDTHNDVLVVPKEAVLAEDDQTAVFLVRDSMAFRQAVQTGYTNDRQIEITSGVAAGDLIITTGQTSLRDSTKVEVIQ